MGNRTLWQPNSKSKILQSHNQLAAGGWLIGTERSSREVASPLPAALTAHESNNQLEAMTTTTSNSSGSSALAQHSKQ